MDPGVRRNGKSSSNFCKYCKIKGHSEDGCFKKKESQDKSFCIENPGSNRLAEMKGFESSNVETTVIRERPAEFLIDSAATTHICNQRDWFSNLKQIYPTEVLVGERDSSAKAVDIGDIKFTIFDIKVSLLGWNHVQLDVKSAYMHGKWNEKEYLKQPPGFIAKDAESKVYLLHKELYGGLHQSGRSWNCELDHILKDLKFDKLLSSNCLYKIKNVILVIYVDGIIVFGKTLNDINKTIALIKSKLDLTELGQAKYLLGVYFEMNKDLFIHQKTYIDKLMIKFKELPKSNVNLPIKLERILPEKTEEKDIVENELMSKFPYRSLIGCLSFLADRTRTDISFSVNLMSQFSNGYRFEHWKIVQSAEKIYEHRDPFKNFSEMKNDL
ncbi:Retrovirus-related Pol polyprotein from transposon TNT 1-94 [Araneus ventricosus]|uniref:Retrovirus-related Pol polyprotein from transposon TNT 1-94 n=1 Tax=Araneus ventricosus TaxID=182803 RepID=A0A4Y2VQB8_ARAVE|nr:Retrovirus-related Pol polyprotein from transposon TNT 1-94 [Araneus ventricosus]